MIHFGIVKPGSTLRIPFDTFALSTGAPTALSNFAVGDILVYKDSDTTERVSTTGYTATTTFDSLTGNNEAIVDLSSDATADFFKAGSSYKVVLSPVTVDGQTMTFTIATFTIGYPNAVLNTSIATLSSQTSFTLTAGPAEDDALNGMWAIVHDKASAVQATWVQILDYTGSTKTVTLAATPAATFTIAAIDNFSVMGVMPLQPAVTGRTLAIDSSGAVDSTSAGGFMVSSPFSPLGKTIVVPADAAAPSGVQASVQSGDNAEAHLYEVYNSGSVLVHVAFSGKSAAEAATLAVAAIAGTPSSAVPIQAHSGMMISAPPKSYWSAISASPATVYVTPGKGV